MTIGKLIRTRFAAILLASFSLAGLGMVQFMHIA